jgi:hypothetical protein
MSTRSRVIFIVVVTGVLIPAAALHAQAAPASPSPSIWTAFPRPAAERRGTDLSPTESGVPRIPYGGGSKDT